jgi:hypothetical protein
MFVVFYERYRPWLQGKLGRETKSWPEFFRFCWTIRNACTYHDEEAASLLQIFCFCSSRCQTS